MTVKEWTEQYMDAHFNWEASTRANAERMARCHVYPILGSYNVSEVTPVLLYEWVKKLNKKLAPVTVRDSVRFVRSVLEWAVDNNIIPKNPAKRLVLPKVDQHETRVLTEEEIKDLCEKLRGTNLHIPVVLAVSTGLRRGEIMGLVWGDIDGKVLHVRRSLGPHGMKEPKTRSSKRNVVLPDWTLQEIGKTPRKQNASDPVVSSLTPAGLTVAFLRAAKKAGYEGLTFHGLRHTHASILLKHGVNIKVISKRLGHKNTTITLNTYAHLMPGMDEEAAAVLDGLL